MTDRPQVVPATVCPSCGALVKLHEMPTASSDLYPIVNAVSLHYNIEAKAILGRGRTRPVVHARHVAMFLCRTTTRASLPRIAEVFGGRDHSSVAHACKRIAEQIRRDLVVASAVNMIARRLQAKRTISGPPKE